MECHTANYEGDPDFDYSGDFECRLKSLYSKEVYSTLLTDNPDQKRDWQSRGRFLIEELIGSCAEYPEYGRVRHFKLRGMKITLSIRDLKLNSNNSTNYTKKKRPELKSFYFDVDIKADLSAVSEIAESVPYLEPPYINPNDPKDMSRKCDKVLLKQEK